MNGQAYQTRYTGLQHFHPEYSNTETARRTNSASVKPVHRRNRYDGFSFYALPPGKL